MKKYLLEPDMKNSYIYIKVDILLMYSFLCVGCYRHLSMCKIIETNMVKNDSPGVFTFLRLN